MSTPIACGLERHAVGSQGEFHLGSAESLLPSLLARYQGAVQLVYLDPPFQTGEQFRMRVDGKSLQTPAYSDQLSDMQYLAMMRSVLAGCYDLLSPTGSIYVHVDYRMAAQIRMMLDELFGKRQFRNEIIWAYHSGGRSKRYYPRKHDTIFYYVKSSKAYFDIASVGTPRGTIRRNHMKQSIDSDGQVYYSIKSNGKQYKYYENSLIYPSDVWSDIPHLHQRDPERTGYATQKPEALLRRIILASSKEGDIVADLFAGSGTTAAAACKTGRRFLLADRSPFSLYAARKRLYAANNEPSLFHENESAVSFYFNGKLPANAAIQASLQSTRFGYCCDVTAYTVAGTPTQLLYAALGAFQDGVFSPHSYIDTPRFPFHMELQHQKMPVLQTMDSHGTQAFWLLDAKDCML